MKDLTQGSIPKHLIAMAVPMVIGMFVQTLYFLVDLYFVGKLGGVAIAGVSAAGNAMFIILGLTQIINVGTASLISHAVGRKDRFDANLLFNQALVLSTLLGLLTFIGGYLLAEDYLHTIASDPATVDAGLSYLYWFIPSMALQFALELVSLKSLGVDPKLTTTMQISIVFLMLPNALLAAALQMLTSLFAKTFKEAQSYIGLLVMVPMAPVLATMIGGAKSADWMFFVPILGQQQLLTGIMRGEGMNFLSVVTATGVTVLLSGIIVIVLTRLLRSERVVYGG